MLHKSKEELVEEYSEQEFAVQPTLAELLARTDVLERRLLSLAELFCTLKS